MTLPRLCVELNQLKDVMETSAGVVAWHGFTLVVDVDAAVVVDWHQPSATSGRTRTIELRVNILAVLVC